jgi:hypothetical protein
MAEPSKKNPRSKNYTEYERKLLVDLLKIHGNGIVESKKKDVKTIAKKKKVWEEILKDFNADHQVNKRELRQLQTLWKDMKFSAKKDVARVARERTKTGGGKPPDDIDSLTEEFVGIIPEQFESINAPDDDEGKLINQ